MVGPPWSCAQTAWRCSEHRLGDQFGSHFLLVHGARFQQVRGDLQWWPARLQAWSASLQPHLLRRPYRALRARLLLLGVVLYIRVRSTSTGFLKPVVPEYGHDAADGAPVVEATYVDDEALLLASSSPAALVIAIKQLVTELVAVFAAFNLQINWARGKTEAFVRFRGKASQDASRKLFGTTPGQDGQLTVVTPHGSCLLRAVHNYTYLGSVLAADGNPLGDVARRVQSASAAYLPLAKKVFGQPKFPVELRLFLLCSLVLSRLLYGVHTWSRISIEGYKRLNAVYMRALRQVAGCCRFKAGNNLTDYEVRVLLKRSSLQWLISKARLMMLIPLLTAGNPATLAMLASQTKSGSRLPWVQLLFGDLQLLFTHLRADCIGLGDPTVQHNLERWALFITTFPADWRRLVSKVEVFSLSLDEALAHKQCDPVQAPPAALAQFRCHLCSVAFGSARGLATHIRTKHKQRTELRTFLDGSGRCPVCAVQFPSRLRLLAHVSEKRVRGNQSQSAVTCRSVLESGAIASLDADLVASLDEADRALRYKARQHGRCVPAVVVRTQRSKIRGAPDPQLGERLAVATGKRLAAETVMRDFTGEHLATETGTVKPTCMSSVPITKRRRLTFKQPAYFTGQSAQLATAPSPTSCTSRRS